MDFSFTDEQSMLRDSLKSYLADHYSFDARREALKTAPHWRADVWRAFANDLGILGAPFPEDLGGLGGGAIENMVVMEELGAALVVEPYLATVVIGGGFLKRSAHPGASALIARIVAGESIIAFAYAEPQARYTWRDLKTKATKQGAGYLLNGHKAVVVAAPYADKLIVTARTGGSQRDQKGVSVFLVDAKAKGVSVQDFTTVDGFRAGEVHFENVALGGDALLGTEGDGLVLIEAVIDEAIAALCAEGCGVLRKLHSSTIEYTRQRKQFGQSISSFQVLQHRMVDMFIQVEQSISMTYMATIKLAEPAPERAKAISAAKVQIAKACKFVGQNAIQLHGGMGMTDEMAIGHYFKRATMIETMFGGLDHHLARYEHLSIASAQV